MINCLGVYRSGCDVLQIGSDEQINVLIKFDEIVEQFVEDYGFDSIVVLISSNSRFSWTIRYVRRREVTVLLIYGQNPSEDLIKNASDSVAFDDVFDLNRTGIQTICLTSKLISNEYIRIVRVLWFRPEGQACGRPHNRSPECLQI